MASAFQVPAIGNYIVRYDAYPIGTTAFPGTTVFLGLQVNGASVPNSSIRLNYSEVFSNFVSGQILLSMLLLIFNKLIDS